MRILVANIAKEAFSTGKTVHQVSRERKVLPEKELNRVLDPMRLTKPGIFSKRAITRKGETYRQEKT